MTQGSLRIGTSSWSAADWVGPFYPPGTPAAKFLQYYAQRFDTVECDATFYAIPAEKTVDGWAAKTSEDFLFCAKLPREITHDKGLVGCQNAVSAFTGVMSRLGPRLGPLVAQFPYIAKGRDAAEYQTGDDFRARLAAFLREWPAEISLVVEIRNALWLGDPLLDLLRAHGVGLVLPAIYTMPKPRALFARVNPVTSDLIYVRFLGHHREMDRLVARLKREGKRSGEWSELALDRRAEMRDWVRPLKQRAEAGAQVRVYFNNHYAGYAPDSADLFRQMWDEIES